MPFAFNHTNINVFDLDRSIEFYQKALNLKVTRIKDGPDGAFRLAFLQDGETSASIELTWLADRQDPYNLGDNETHLAFTAADFDAAYQLHKEMDCICFENKAMGVYFINDPDGYWIEILPPRK